MKLLKICAISTIALFSGQLKAESETATKTIDINELQVTAQKSQIASDNLRIISTISSEMIKKAPVANINELLEQLPGIDIRQRGGNGVQADLSMRGGTFDQVMILLNGVNITDTQTGHHNLDLPIDLDAIERIELLQGTSMQQFGLSAFSGAINIITKSGAEGYQVESALSGGMNGLQNAAVNGNWSNEKWSVMASLSDNSSDGYMANTDYDYSNAFVQTTFADSVAGNFDFQIGGQLKEFGANGFYSLKYPNQFEATKTLFTSLRWQKQINRWGVEASTFYRTHYDRFELIRAMEDAPSWYKNHNYHVTHTTGGNFKTHYASKIGKTSAGVEVRNERIRSNVLGDALENQSSVPFTQDSILFKNGKNRMNLNYFAEQAFYKGNWAASLGVSGNYNNMFGHNGSIGANVAYQFATQGNIYLNVNRSLRLPTFTDLYYKSATQIANPNLKPETAWNGELGARWQKNGFAAQGSAFYRIGENIIDWVKAPADEKWKSMNHTRIDAMGGELTASYTYGTWLHKLSATYSFVHLEKSTTDNLLSKYALDYLKHKFTVQLNHRIYRGFGANWTLNMQDRNGQFEDIDGKLRTYEPFALLDGRIYWKNEHLTIYVEASNITDRLYYDYGGIMQPGIWAKGGVKVKL